MLTFPLHMNFSMKANFRTNSVSCFQDGKHGFKKNLHSFLTKNWNSTLKNNIPALQTCSKQWA